MKIYIKVKAVPDDGLGTPEKQIDFSEPNVKCENCEHAVKGFFHADRLYCRGEGIVNKNSYCEQFTERKGCGHCNNGKPHLTEDGRRIYVGPPGDVTMTGADFKGVTNFPAGTIAFCPWCGYQLSELEINEECDRK